MHFKYCLVLLILGLGLAAAAGGDGKYRPDKGAGKYRPDNSGKYVSDVDKYRYVHVHIPYDGGYGPFEDPYAHDGRPYDPFSDNYPYIHDPRPYVPFKDQYGYDPFKDHYPYDPFRDRYPYNQDDNKGAETNTPHPFDVKEFHIEKPAIVREYGPPLFNSAVESAKRSEKVEESPKTTVKPRAAETGKYDPKFNNRAPVKAPHTDLKTPHFDSNTVSRSSSGISVQSEQPQAPPGFKSVLRSQENKLPLAPQPFPVDSKSVLRTQENKLPVAPLPFPVDSKSVLKIQENQVQDTHLGTTIESKSAIDFPIQSKSVLRNLEKESKTIENQILPIQDAPDVTKTLNAVHKKLDEKKIETDEPQMLQKAASEEPKMKVTEDDAILPHNNLQVQANSRFLGVSKILTSEQPAKETQAVVVKTANLNPKILASTSVLVSKEGDNSIVQGSVKEITADPKEELSLDF